MSGVDEANKVMDDLEDIILCVYDVRKKETLDKLENEVGLCVLVLKHPPNSFSPLSETQKTTVEPSLWLD